ncbi:PEP-CTERM sorting domain-containing protein [bacterium]|nr:MAG: PEP-CTERM sorting domain-containing protein [bacterium]
MSLASPKAVAVAAALVGTWAVADAAPVTVNYDTTIQIDNVRVYSESYAEGASAEYDIIAPPGEFLGSAVTADQGTIQANAAGSFEIDAAYNSGSSTYGGIVGTSSGSIVLGLSSLDAPTAEAYLEAATTEGYVFDDVYSAILSGDATRLRSLYGLTPTYIPGSGPFPGYTDLTSPNGFMLADFDGATLDATSDTYNLYSFTRTGDSVTASGTLGSGNFAVNAVPEPASMAALGFGALALLRRRRRKA